MVDFDKLKSEIRFKIRANRRQEISGTVLQIQLIDLADAIETSVNKLAEDLSLNQEQVNQTLTTIVQSLTTKIEGVNTAVTAEATNRRAADERITKELEKKVNAVEGKGLSSNDFTDLEKQNLSKLQSDAVKMSQDIKTLQQEVIELRKIIEERPSETSNILGTAKVGYAVLS